MRRNGFTSLQFATLTFSFLYGGSLLSPGAYGAGRSAWASCALGCLLGILLLYALSTLAEEGIGFRSAPLALRLVFFLLLFFHLYLRFADFGLFQTTAMDAPLPPALCALLLFLPILLCVSHGSSCLGRFGETVTLLTLPLLLLLLPLGRGVGELPELVFDARLASSAQGVFLSGFSDGIALFVLADEVTEVGRETVWARAQIKPFSLRHPIRTPVFLGAAGASILQTLVIALSQWGCGASVLAEARYPVATTASLLHHRTLAPFFLLCLTLLHTVKLAMLLLALLRLTDSILPGREEKRLLLPLIALLLSLFPLLGALPDLADRVRTLPHLKPILAFFGAILPFFWGIAVFFKKRFDKRRKV